MSAIIYCWMNAHCGDETIYVDHHSDVVFIVGCFCLDFSYEIVAIYVKSLNVIVECVHFSANGDFGLFCDRLKTVPCSQRSKGEALSSWCLDT